MIVNAKIPSQSSPSAQTDVYVAGSLLQLLCSFLDKQRLDAPHIRAQLTQMQGRQHISMNQWWQLLEHIEQAAQSKDARIQGVGLQIGQHIAPHHLGVLGYLVTHCDTVEQALIRISRFQLLIHNLVPAYVRHEKEKGCVIFEYAHRGLSTRLSDEVLFSAMVNFIRTATSVSDFKPLCVVFRQSAPAHSESYQTFFGCEVRFNGAGSAIHFSAQQCQLPIVHQDPHLLNILEQQAQAMLCANAQQDVWVTKLQEHIIHAMQDNTPFLAVVAQRMGLSERTCQRQLTLRGLTFKTLLNQARFELAKRYLQDVKLSLCEIALLVGYAEQSVFTRAFKQWSGVSPLHYRKHYR